LTQTWKNQHSKCLSPPFLVVDNAVVMCRYKIRKMREF
jgi:hypothetical protein